jgi:hypothetical protein
MEDVEASGGLAVAASLHVLPSLAEFFFLFALVGVAL